MELLKIENLSLYVENELGEINLTNNISLTLKQGSTVGIIGESGCGKSITATSILGLNSKRIKTKNGNIYFEGKNISNLSNSERRKLAGKKIGMVFQEPMTALNPVFKIGKQLSDPIKMHLNLNKEETQKLCIELLDSVGIKDPKHVLNSYPHQLSGGMRQRVIIAMAISCNPKLLIADEPTTALDATIQLQILHIIKDLVKEKNMSLLIISHDMGVISMLSERVIVMYAGEILEEDNLDTIMNHPSHPYTKKLTSVAKELYDGNENLTIVKGSVPKPGEIIKSCKFADRCEFAFQKCYEEHPNLKTKKEGGGLLRCWKEE